MRSNRVLVLVGVACLAACSTEPNSGSSAADAAHGASESQAAEVERGPHGGRLLREGDFAIELAIFEEGVPPEFHVYGYVGDEPLPPSQFAARVTLSRLGGRIERFKFSPVGAFLRGDGVVREPHSFDVQVEAEHRGKTHRWSYASYEGRTEIAPAIAEAAGIAVEQAGPAVLRQIVKLTGAIQARADRRAEVVARFPGVVRELRANVGERVARGATLARVQSNESLETYAITAPIGGTVLERDAQVGVVTGSAPLFVIADLDSVWGELQAFGEDLRRLRPGQAVEVEAVDGSATGTGTVHQIAPVTSLASQSVRARVLLANDGRWRPGQFIEARVTVAEARVPLAVKNSALQPFRDFQVVFARVGSTYEVRMLELGRADRESTEVLSGLDPGEQYVTANSFLVKADVEKSGAAHHH